MNPTAQIMEHPASFDNYTDHFVYIPRKVAKDRGIKRYYDGRICKNGHQVAKWTTDTRCYICAKQRVNDKYAENPGKARQRSADYLNENREVVNERNATRLRELRKKDPERFRKYDQAKRTKIMSSDERREKEKQRCREKEKRRYQSDPVGNAKRMRDKRANDPELREKEKQRSKEYRKRNPHVTKALNLKHNHKDRAARKQRLPKWVTKEELKQITDLYKLAKELGMHVDHIIPLQGKTVSGLHTIENLQLLTPSENLAKKNRFEVEL